MSIHQNFTLVNFTIVPSSSSQNMGPMGIWITSEWEILSAGGSSTWNHGYWDKPWELDSSVPRSCQGPPHGRWLKPFYKCLANLWAVFICFQIASARGRQVYRVQPCVYVDNLDVCCRLQIEQHGWFGAQTLDLTLGTAQIKIRQVNSSIASLSSVPASMFRVLPRCMVSAQCFRCDWYNCYRNIQIKRWHCFAMKVGAQHISDVLLTRVAQKPSLAVKK